MLVSPDVRLGRLIAGGQTGVDQGALAGALDVGFPCGGWCPRGRKSERGVIPGRFPLREASTDLYPHRTRLNVRDSDGTILITHLPPGDGTALTAEMACRLRRPVLLLTPGELGDPQKGKDVSIWLANHKISVVNVAGPRESECLGIGEAVRTFFREFLHDLISAGRMGPPADWPPSEPTTPMLPGLANT